MLESLVHLNFPSPPPGFLYVKIEIPDKVSVEEVDDEALVGWSAADMKVSRAFGDKWYKDQRSGIR
jgi:hypothetical protein